jgi:hypothetical protein
MPAGILNLTVGSTQITLNTTAQQLNSGSLTLGTSFNTTLAANPGYIYGPGMYTLVITYTLTAQ